MDYAEAARRLAGLLDEAAAVAAGTVAVGPDVPVPAAAAPAADAPASTPDPAPDAPAGTSAADPNAVPHPVSAAALEATGPVHTEALLASLAAYVQAAQLARASATQPTALTPAGAPLQPLPEKTAEIRLDFPLTPEQFEALKPSHVPADGWDRWYAEYDGSHLRYYRNASGYCFFEAAIEPAGEGFMVTDVVVNQDDNQYTETNLRICAAQLKILLATDLGLDDEPYWDEMD